MDFITTLYASFAILFASVALGFGAWASPTEWRWPLLGGAALALVLGLRTLGKALGRWLEEAAQRDVEAVLASLPPACRWLAGPLPLGIDHVVISPTRVTLIWQRHWQGAIEARPQGPWLVDGGRPEASPLPLLSLAERAIAARLGQGLEVKGVVLLTSPLAQVQGGEDLPLLRVDELYNHLTEGAPVDLDPEAVRQLKAHWLELRQLVGQPNEALLQGPQGSGSAAGAEVGVAAGVT